MRTGFGEMEKTMAAERAQGKREYPDDIVPIGNAVISAEESDDIVLVDEMQ